MNTTRMGWAAIASAFLAGLVLLVPFAFMAMAPAADDDGPTSSEEKTPSEDLTVRPGDILPQEARCASDEFITNSLPNSNLVWSDSVSTPFTAEDAEGMFSEVLLENCGNPTVLMMNVEALASIDIEDGLTIGDVNPWMAEFIAQKESGMKELTFLTKKVDNGDNIFVTMDFQGVAELTNTVLLRLKIAGITSEDSLRNWHIPAREGLAAGGLPVAMLNSQEEVDREVLRLEYSLKVDECPLFAVGFNTADKRFELLQVNCDSTTPPVPKTPPGTPPTSTPPPCPPGQVPNVNGTCVTPKSSDPDDYKTPDEKPIVKETRPPLAEPEPVETSKPGGGGIVDSPTNPPGSESGVTAPGATPAPTTPSTPPPNEGDDAVVPQPTPIW